MTTEIQEATTVDEFLEKILNAVARFGQLARELEQLCKEHGPFDDDSRYRIAHAQYIDESSDLERRIGAKAYEIFRHEYAELRCEGQHTYALERLLGLEPDRADRGWCKMTIWDVCHRVLDREVREDRRNNPPQPLQLKIRCEVPGNGMVADIIDESGELKGPRGGYWISPEDWKAFVGQVLDSEKKGAGLGQLGR